MAMPGGCNTVLANSTQTLALEPNKENNIPTKPQKKPSRSKLMAPFFLG